MTISQTHSELAMFSQFPIDIVNVPVQEGHKISMDIADNFRANACGQLLALVVDF